MSMRQPAPPSGWFEQGAAASLLVVAVLLSVLLIRAPGTSDVGMFLIWGTHGEQHGIIGGYHMMVDNWARSVLENDREAGGGEYPPLGVAWLTWQFEFGDLFGLSHFITFKVGLLASSLLSTCMMGWWSRSLAVAAAFQFATLISVAGLGYTDIVPIPFVIGVFWAIREARFVLGFFLLLLAVLVKWQCMLLAPILLLYMLDISDLRSIGRAVARRLPWQMAGVLAVVGGLVGALFGVAPLQAFHLALGHPFLSGTTLNVPWIATFAYHLLFSPGFSIGDEIGYLVLPPADLLPFRALFFLLFGIILWRYLRTERSYYGCVYFSILTVITYGVWNSAVHENHWFVALAPAFILMIEHRSAASRWIAVLVTLMLNVNLLVFYGVTGSELVARTVGVDLSLVFSVIYVGIWLLLMGHGWSLGRARARSR